MPARFHSRINALWREYVYRFAVVKCLSEVDKSPQQIQYQNLRAYLPVSQVNRCHIVGYACLLLFSYPAYVLYLSPLDLDLVYQCIDRLNGEHDFVSFATKSTDSIGRNTVKNVEIGLHECQPLTTFELANKAYQRLQFYEFHIKSKSFLYNQVR